MNLTGFSLNNSRFVMLLVGLLVVTGIAMSTNFPSKEDAVVTIRDAVVTTWKISTTSNPPQACLLST